MSSNNINLAGEVLVEGVVLAAGFSTRAGVYKMELDFDGKTMIERSIDTFYDLCSRVIVVGGYQIERIQEIAKKYPNVQVVYNENYQDGMFSSVKKGFSEIVADKIFFTPGDYPLINHRTCEKILHSKGDVVIPSWKGKSGHPILLSRNVVEEILLEPDHSNLKGFLRRKIATYVDVNDPGILMDVDTLRDYEYVLKHYRSLFTK